MAYEVQARVCKRLRWRLERPLVRVELNRTGESRRRRAPRRLASVLFFPHVASRQRPCAVSSSVIQTIVMREATEPMQEGQNASELPEPLGCGCHDDAALARVARKPRRDDSPRNSNSHRDLPLSSPGCRRLSRRPLCVRLSQS
jgi:hypothetical protein